MTFTLERFTTGKPSGVAKANAIIDAVEAVSRRVDEWEALYQFPPKPLLMRITGWAAFNGNQHRWRYAWTEVYLDTSDADQNREFRSGTTSNFYALNLCEVNNVNSPNQVQGNSIDLGGSDFPSGFSLMPVGGGTGGTPDNQVIVIGHMIPDGANGLRPVFQYENAVDGTCD